MSNDDSACIDRINQRSRFFYLEFSKSGVDSAVQSENPYEYDKSGQLVYTPSMLDMRRKVEILKYNKNRTTTQASKRRQYAYLSTKHPTNKNIVCKNTPILSSSSDVPGPVIPLVLYEDVPLYNYNINPVFQQVDYDAMKRVFDDFPLYNIDGLNGTTNTMTNLVILNPNNNMFTYNLSVPIYVQYNADYMPGGADPITSAQIYIYSAVVFVYYSSTLVHTTSATFRTAPSTQPTDIVESTLTASLSFNTSQNTPITVSQYAGVLYFSDIPLQTITEYVYTFKINVKIGYAEYNSGVNPIRTNHEGGDITNAGATNITNVKYNTIVNIESKDKKPRIIQGCDVDLFDINNNTINYNSVGYIPYSLSGTPS